MKFAAVAYLIGIGYMFSKSGLDVKLLGAVKRVNDKIIVHNIRVMENAVALTAEKAGHSDGAP